MPHFRFSQKSKRRACALAFLLAATGQTAPAFALDALDGAAAKETWWKTNLVDAVIRLRPCPGQGVCGDIVWINPQDKSAHDYFGDPNLRRPTEKDVRALCGFSPRMDFRQVAPHVWKGTMEMRGQGITVDMEVVRRNENELQVRASKFIFSQTDTWTRVAKDDPRYPRCTPPRP